MGVDSKDTEIEARFNRILEEFGKHLRRAVVASCPKDLGISFDDVEQDARLRLLKALRSEREIADPASYLYRIAATAAIDAMRRVAARREIQLQTEEDEDEGQGAVRGPVADPEEAPDRVAERRQLAGAVERALDRLPKNRGPAVRLHLQGMTTQEIGQLLGWSEPKARNLVYRGLHDLRNLLRAEGIDYETQ